jgi:hypothetical protein
VPSRSEADTCRQLVLPKLYAAGWDDDRIAEQRTFTDGRIVVTGSKVRRRPQKRADYLLRYRPDFTIAVVEAKASYKTPAEGLQQGKEYAEILGLKFAYGTNGHGIVEFDYMTGTERELDAFAAPDDLWNRLAAQPGAGSLGALFGGRTTQDMKNRLLVPKGRPLADVLPTITIKAKDFANEITNFNIKERDLRAEVTITSEHVKNNEEVRRVLKDRGITPEALPPAEDVKKVERRLTSEQKKLPRGGKRVELGEPGSAE